MKKEDLCRGCLLINPDNCYICLVSSSELFEHMSEKCPCGTCLIKGMCSIVCDQFLRYIMSGFCCDIEEPKKLRDNFPLALAEGKSLTRVDVLMVLQYRRLFDDKCNKGDLRKWRVVDINEKMKEGKTNE